MGKSMVAESLMLLVGGTPAGVSSKSTLGKGRGSSSDSSCGDRGEWLMSIWCSPTGTLLLSSF